MSKGRLIFLVAISVMFMSSVFLAGSELGGRRVFLKSWHSGSRQIQERVDQVSLNCNGKSTFERIVKDTQGRDAFRLWVYPFDGCQAGQAQGWVVTLWDLTHHTKELLAPTNDPFQDYFTSRDFPGVFSPKVDDHETLRNGIALSDTRVVEVEDFCCILMPTRLTAGLPGKLQAVALEIRLVNKCRPGE